MQFENLLKGQISATMLKVALVQAGYTVTAHGFEDLLPEIAALQRDEFQKIKGTLSPKDWKRPDLKISGDVEAIIEVKFRSDLKEQWPKVRADAEQVLQHWEGTDFVIFRGDSARPECDCAARVIPANILSTITNNIDEVWDRLPTLQERFPKLASVKTLNAILPVLTVLVSLKAA